MPLDNIIPRKVLKLFEDRFGEKPQLLVRAPGRVNLIGEHTDYNEGFVMPAAIEPAIYAAGKKRKDRIVQVAAYDLNESAVFSLPPTDRRKTKAASCQTLFPDQRSSWHNYIRGISNLLLERDIELTGANILIHGNLPIGAGLSSSAALELAILKLLVRLSGPIRLTAQESAFLAQKAEHEYAGTKCGLMDQLAVLYGKKDHALLIDCLHLKIKPVRLPFGCSLLIADTGKRRQLASSAYNKRRQECTEAARLLGVKSLRHATAAMLKKSKLPQLLTRRARHVVEENARVLKFAAALQKANLEEAGHIMNASHISLRDLYEVSCPELDMMVDLLQRQTGCYGARLTGAGFGGCAIALVHSSAAKKIAAQVGNSYSRITGLRSSFVITKAAAGARTRSI